MQQTNNSRMIEDKGRQGIALIMVLGVLTMLTLLAVSFAITMRTERLAAENYVYVVKARHLLNEALAQALFEADDYLGGADPMMYPDFSKSGPPLIDVFVSVGGGEGPLDFLNGEVESFVPLSVWDEAVDAADNYVEWNDIDDPETGDVIGRFAYLVLNCSGLLDANYAGGLTHTNGMDPHEISLNGVDGVTENTFIKARQDTWFRYESLPEINSSDGIDTAKMEDLFCYSWFPEGLYFRGDLAPTSSLVMINNTNLPDYRVKVISAFDSCGVPNPDKVYENLVDYMDQDDFPQDPDSFCTEAIPMINEVVFSNRFECAADGTNYLWYATLSIETWHPFPENSKNCVVYPAVLFESYPGTAVKPVWSVSGASYSQNKFSFKVHNFVMSPPVPFTAANMPKAIRAHVGCTNRLGGEIVDRLPSPFRFEFNFMNPPPGDDAGISLVTLPAGGKISYVQARSVPDPRMNGYAYHWLNEENSLGSMNSNVFQWGEGPSAMFVRNGPLQSVGELGFLSVSGVWETVSLYPHAITRQDGSKVESFHPVLDYFSLGLLNPTNSFRPCDVVTKDTNIVCKGLVNINTRRPKVLGAVLSGTPVEHYPYKPGVEIVGDVVGSEAESYASAVIEESGKENLRGVSEMGKVDELYLNLANDYNDNITLQALYPDAPPNYVSDSVKESIIRNSHQLFGVRQNLFTIILAAQVYDGSAIFGEQRAVAVVWRDPVADSTGRHPTFVRFFKLLAE